MSGATPKVILSLGAGVQSSTLALMCAAGDLPYTIDAAVFADTQAEPRAVYEWLAWLEKQLPFQVHRVTHGNLMVDSLERRTSKQGKRYWKVGIPMFILDTDGRKGKIPRKCTADYKIRPIIKKSRAIVGAGVVRKWARQYGVKRERHTYSDGTQTWRWIKPDGTPPLAYSLIGISRDEIQRVKPSREPWIEHRHPLVDAGLTRKDCLRWMAKMGHPTPPRSACIFCPYHSDAEWRRLKAESPGEFALAAAWEAQAQAQAQAQACEITRGVPYLHSSLRPLSVLRFDAPQETGDLFGEECEWLCGN